jgi:hypothetical protein
MDHIKAARDAERIQRLGSAAQVYPRGDFSHVEKINRLVNGMSYNLDRSNPDHKDAADLLDKASEHYEEAFKLHNEGKHMAALSLVTAMANHTIDAGRKLDPKSLKEAQETYNPYITSAGAAQTHLEAYVKSMNEGAQ